MFAYCNNNPVMYSDSTGKSLVMTSVLAGATIGFNAMGSIGGVLISVGWMGASMGSSACSSSVGAAQPYVNMPGSNDRNSPNCYAYAIGSSINEQPGGRSGRTPTKWNDVNDVGISVEADLKSMGKTVRVINGPNSMVYNNEFKIALRVGTQPYAYNRITGELYYDYHFMRQTNTGQWAEKHGIGGESVLWDSGMTPDTIPWTLNGMEYYDSKIIYYAVGN